MSKKLKWFEKFTDADLELLVDAVKYTLNDTEPATEDIERLKAMIAQLDKIRQSMKAGK